jgi:very-short-patch-repair endonuclease
MSQLALLLNITYQGPSYVSGWRYPVDFYTPDDKVVVQYDSYYYHRLKEDSDKNCNELLTKAGYKIIRVREKPLLATSKNDIFITKKDSAEMIANKVYNIIKQR